ncbi:MAG: peptidylprolyl isomerase [Actinomycetota bacterium]|nr:peptidylprolyl isomerase [Actinomycetota bacterium]
MRRLLGALLVVAMMAGVACGGGGSGNPLEQSAATVNGEKVAADDIRDELAAFKETDQYKQLAQQQGADAISRQFEQVTLARLVRRAVLVPVAEEMGIEVSDDEIDQQLEQVKAQLPNEEAFDKALEERGFTLEEVKMLFHDQLIEQKLQQEVTADAGPTEERVRAEYDANPAAFDETHYQHILVKEEGTAKDLASRLQEAPAGKVDSLFPKLAKEFSEDPSAAENSGDLGFLPSGQLVPEFEEAAAKLDVGEVSAPVQTEFGFHVIRVTGRRSLSFEEAKPQLEQSLGASEGEAAWTSFVKKAYEDADVEINPRFGELDLDTQQIVNPGADQVPGAEEPEE